MQKRDLFLLVYFVYTTVVLDVFFFFFFLCEWILDCQIVTNIQFHHIPNVLDYYIMFIKVFAFLLFVYNSISLNVLLVSNLAFILHHINWQEKCIPKCDQL